MSKKKGLDFSRKRVWTLLEPASDKDTISKITDIFLVSLIFFNILMVILETVESYREKFKISKESFIV